MIVEPSKVTLRKYGLTIDEWREMYNRQGGKCAICGRTPNILQIEHEHVRGWKNMPPEKRRLYLRGLCCYHCNYFFLSKGMTIEKASNIQRYLLDYEKRKST